MPLTRSGKASAFASRLLPAFLLIFSSQSLATEIRIFHPETKVPSAKLMLDGKPRDTFRLSADIFSHPGDIAGEAVPERGNYKEDEFIWKLKCTNGQSGKECVEDAIEFTADGISFRVPDNFEVGEVIEIEVTHESGASPALLSIRNQNSKIEELESSREKKGVSGREAPKARETSKRESRKILSEKRASGGGRGMSGPATRGSRNLRDSQRAKAKGRKKEYDRGAEERAFGEFYSSGGASSSGDRSASGPVTTARGYNRDNTTPVLACTQQLKAGGGFEIRCAEPKVKVLRVRRAVHAKNSEVRISEKKKWPKKSSSKVTAGQAKVPIKPVRQMKPKPKEAYGPPVPRPRKPATE